jgi:Arc/MetJ family transcription regulator
MRTKIEIDMLLAEAMATTGLRTKRKVVEAGLRLLARHKRQANARELFGRVRWEGDLDRERLDGPAMPDRREGAACALRGASAQAPAAAVQSP